MRYRYGGIVAQSKVGGRRRLEMKYGSTYRGIVAQSKNGRRRGLEMKYKYRYRGTAVQCKDGGRRLEIKYRSIEVS